MQPLQASERAINRIHQCLINMRSLSTEAVVWRCSVKKVLLEISPNFESFLNKVAGPRTLLKIEILSQVFSCQFGEIPKNTFSYRKTLVAASE